MQTIHEAESCLLELWKKELAAILTKDKGSESLLNTLPKNTGIRYSMDIVEGVCGLSIYFSNLVCFEIETKLDLKQFKIDVELDISEGDATVEGAILLTNKLEYVVTKDNLSKLLAVLLIKYGV